MSEYLTKEEIRRWRSSLERITLEEYAARLGKVIQEEKHDESLASSVILTALNSMTDEEYKPKTEKIQALAVKSFAKEKEIYTKETAAPVQNTEENVKKESVQDNQPKTKKAKAEKEVKEEPLNVSFKKALTEREQTVFDYFAANRNNIVYAKDLAKILELPRDYVYKYIKNLRSKLEEDILENAENGGYMLKV